MLRFQIAQHAAPTVEEFQQLFGMFRGMHAADASRLIAACDVWRVPAGHVMLKADEDAQCVVAVLKVRMPEHHPTPCMHCPAW